MKNNFLSVVKFNYMQGLKSNWFIALMLTGILVVGLGVNYQKIADIFMESEAALINVVDLTENEFFTMQFSETDANVSGKVKYAFVDENSIVQIKKSIEEGNGDAEGLIVFSSESPNVSIYYGDKIDVSILEGYVVPTMQQLSQLYKAVNLNLSPVEIQSLLLEETLSIEYIAKDSAAAGYGLLLIFLFILYILIMLYGGILANAVVEEKSSRVIENLLCYCKPFSLMFGKITAYFFLAFTHIIVWVLSILILIKLFPIEAISSELVDEILSMKTIFLFAFSLLSGFLMYASAYVAFASYADNSQDSSQLMLPMTIVLMMSFFVAMFSLRHLDSSLSIVLSYCPFLSPIVYFGEAIYRGTSAWNMFLHFGVQVLEVLLIALVASKYYKKGVFKYGSSGSNLFLNKKLNKKEE